MYIKLVILAMLFRTLKEFLKPEQKSRVGKFRWWCDISCHRRSATIVNCNDGFRSVHISQHGYRTRPILEEIPFAKPFESPAAEKPMKCENLRNFSTCHHTTSRNQT